MTYRIDPCPGFRGAVFALATVLAAGAAAMSGPAHASPTSARAAEPARHDVEPLAIGVPAVDAVRGKAAIRVADAGRRPRHDDAYRPDRADEGYAPPRPVERFPASRDERSPYGDAYERYDRAQTEERPPRTERYGRSDDRAAERPGGGASERAHDAYRPEYRPEYRADRDHTGRVHDDADRRRIVPYGRDDVASLRRPGDPVRGDRDDSAHGEPYRPPHVEGRARAFDRDDGDDFEAPGDGRTYTMSEIRDAGHRFFGSISGGLASVIEHAFRRAGRPNGYILGEDAGGAFVAGLRYGRGLLHTKNVGSFPVYWQGPSVGFDAGAEGSRVMVLVYNLVDPEEIYDRFAGVAGSAYVIGGVGLTFQGNERVTLAPIRAGVGLRLGANVGYLKYTRRPTWNPF